MSNYQRHASAKTQPDGSFTLLSFASTTDGEERDSRIQERLLCNVKAAQNQQTPLAKLQHERNKPRWPRKGQGLKPVKQGEETVTLSLRVTVAQREAGTLGGAGGCVARSTRPRNLTRFRHFSDEFGDDEMSKQWGMVTVLAK